MHMSVQSSSSRFATPLTAAAGQPRAAELTASLQLAAVLALLWLGLFEGQQLIFGGAAVVVVVFVCRHVAPLQPMQVSLVGLCSFTAHFVVQSLAGAIDVAYRALHPYGMLEVGRWSYQVRLPEGQARLLFVGCIGLIPGAVGQSLRGNELIVHSIAGDPQQGLAALERRVAALYGLTLGGEDA